MRCKTGRMPFSPVNWNRLKEVVPSSENNFAN